MPSYVISEADLAAIEAWIGTVKSANTKRAYRRCAERFLTAIRKPLAEVVDGDVRGYVARLRENTPASFRPVAGAVRAFLTHALKSGIIPTDLSKNISTAAPGQPVANRTLTECDVTKMILLESDERNFGMLLVAYSSGLQISELAALKWRDIVNEENGRPFLALPDKRGTMRKLALSPATWEALRSLRGHARPEHPVFLSKKGGHLHPSAIHRVVKTAAERAGLPEDTSSYWLRHSHVAHKLNEGTPVHLIQAAFGHADRRTTQRYANRARASERYGVLS